MYLMLDLSERSIASLADRQLVVELLDQMAHTTDFKFMCLFYLWCLLLGLRHSLLENLLSETFQHALGVQDWEHTGAELWYNLNWTLFKFKYIGRNST